MNPEDMLPAEETFEHAFEHAVGLLRGDARAAASVRLESDDRLRASVDWWQQKLAVLDEADESSEAPPAGLFDSILSRIDAEGLQLPGTYTRRGETARWREIAPGVMSRVLYIDRVNDRQSLLIRMAAGSVYHSHAHDAVEEAFVVEGDLSFGDLKLVSGDHHIAAPASHHPPGSTVGGCIVHVVTSLSC